MFLTPIRSRITRFIESNKKDSAAQTTESEISLQQLIGNYRISGCHGDVLLDDGVHLHGEFFHRCDVRAHRYGVRVLRPCACVHVLCVLALPHDVYPLHHVARLGAVLC